MGLGGLSSAAGLFGVRSITLVQTDPLPDLPPAASAGARLASIAKAVALVASDIDLPGKWKADAVTTQTHRRSSQITQHPVENGFRITDHRRRMPKMLTFSGIVSDTPISILGVLQSQVNAATFQSRALDAKAKLDDWYESGEPLFVASSLGVYPTMMIREYSITRDGNSGNAIVFNLALEEIRIGSSTIAAALADDAALLAGAGPTTNGGTLPMTPAF